MSDKQITSMLTYGQGPRITVENLDNGNVKFNGQHLASINRTTGKITNANNGKGLIKLDEFVVGKYENAGTQLDKQAGEILVESTLLHESVHFGDIANDGIINTSITKPDGTIDTFTEIGKAFERAAYGLDIDRGNADQYVKNQQPARIKLRPIQVELVKREELKLE